MNREIKFRAWDKENNIMMECKCLDLLIHFDGELNSFDSNGEIIGTEFTNDMELMQYTGLKDKHGKEIYEGDILRCYTQESDGFISAELYGVVEYIGNCYCVNKNNLWVCAESFEIIGNIYEDKELLEG